MLINFPLCCFGFSSHICIFNSGTSFYAGDPYLHNPTYFLGLQVGKVGKNFTQVQVKLLIKIITQIKK